MRHELSRTAEKLINSKIGCGFNVDYHVLDGSAVYAKLYYAFAKLIDRHDRRPFWVYKKAFAEVAGMPMRVYAYALYKFESESYVYANGTKLFVTEDHLGNWESLHEKITARLAEKKP